MDISPLSNPPLHRRVFLCPDVALWVVAIVAVVNDSAAHDTSAKRISTGRTCAERARTGCTRVECA
jgi:hypothetical protein